MRTTLLLSLTFLGLSSLAWAQGQRTVKELRPALSREVTPTETQPSIGPSLSEPAGSSATEHRLAPAIVPPLQTATSKEAVPGSTEESPSKSAAHQTIQLQQTVKKELKPE
jgi:cytoskeletal protein RodZ